MQDLPEPRLEGSYRLARGRRIGFAEWGRAEGVPVLWFHGTPGVVLHLGDSITYASPYTAWARAGEGKTKADAAVLRWSHCGEENDRDGWYLAHVDLPEGRSYTAASGIRADQYLAGGFVGLFLVGWIRDLTGAYRLAFLVLGLMACVAALLAIRRTGIVPSGAHGVDRPTTTRNAG